MKSPLDLLRLYLTQLWVHLSVVRIEDDHQPSSTSINRTYLVTSLAFILTVIHGIFGLHLEVGLPLTITSLQSSNFIFWRQFFIPQTWPQMDIIWSVLFLFAAAIFDFAFKEIEERHQFVISSSNGRVKLAGWDLSPTESTQILKIFHRAKLTYKLFGSGLYTCAMLYAYVMVFLVTKIYTFSFWTFAFWIVEYSLMYLLIILFFIINLIHIIISGSCIQARQQYLCGRFTRLLGELKHRKQPSIRQFHYILFEYFNINRAVLSIGLQLEAFNTFYTNYLTLIFFEYNVVQVLLTYIVFFVPSKGSIAMLIMKSIFVVIILEMAVLLFGLIQYCARVVGKNGQISRMNRRFAVYCLRGQARYQLRIGVLLKIEHLQWPRLLHFYAFKLFGNARITSKTFYAMAINITCFFLFVMKRMH